MAIRNSETPIKDGVEQLSIPVPGDFDKPEAYKFPEDEEAPDEALVHPSDIEKAIPDADKPHLDPTNMGYWLEEGFSLALIYRDRRSNEYRYYVVEPYISEDEQTIIDYLNNKLVVDIDYDDIPLESTEEQKERIIQAHLNALFRRYDLLPRGVLQGVEDYYSESADGDGQDISSLGRTKQLFVRFVSRFVSASPGSDAKESSESSMLNKTGVDAEEPTDEDIQNVGQLTRRQGDKIMYELSKEYVDYKKITPLLHDVNIEDVSVDGYHEPVWIYHSSYGDLKTNLSYGKEDLDKTVKYMAESDGRGISKRQPTVNVTLDDGSRAQLTLAHEVSEKGSNFTIRLYRDVPFTPIDLINWETYNIEQMAYLWLCVENDQKILFCGGTGAGKTTTLNACSLFIPKEKIVSIEDTPELTLPHENWVQSTTREHEMSGDAMNYEEFDLVEEAMRQRPSYILVGEVRNQKAANALMQTIETGHTSFSTFHADSVPGVINRFTNDPINVAAAQFSAIDLICLQEQLHIDGQRMRRAKSMTEIGDFNRDKGTVEQDRLYEYNPAEEEFIRKGDSSLLAKIQYRNGWTPEETWDEFERRKTVLSYLIRKGIQDYGDVAAVIQGYMRDPDAIMALIAHERLKDHLPDLRNLDSLDLDINERAEEKLTRPVSEDMMAEAENVLADNWDLVMETESYDIGDVFGIADQVRNYDTKYPFGEQIKEAQEAAAEEQQHHDDTRFDVEADEPEDHFDAVRDGADDGQFATDAAPTGEEADDPLDDLFDEEPSDAEADAESESEDADEQTEEETEESPGLLTRLLPWRSSGGDSETSDEPTDEETDADSDSEPTTEPEEESLGDVTEPKPSGEAVETSTGEDAVAPSQQDIDIESSEDSPQDTPASAAQESGRNEDEHSKQESPVAGAASEQGSEADEEEAFSFVGDDDSQPTSAGNGDTADDGDTAGEGDTTDRVRESETISVTSQPSTDEAEADTAADADQNAPDASETSSGGNAHVEATVGDETEPDAPTTTDSESEAATEENPADEDTSTDQESSDAKPDEVANPFADEDPGEDSETAFVEGDDESSPEKPKTNSDTETVESEASGASHEETDSAQSDTGADEPDESGDPYQPDITEEDIEQLKGEGEAEAESQPEATESEPETAESQPGTAESQSETTASTDPVQDEQSSTDPEQTESEEQPASSEADDGGDVQNDPFVSTDELAEDGDKATDSKAPSEEQESAEPTQGSAVDADEADDGESEDIVDAVDSAMDVLDEGKEDTQPEASSSSETESEKAADTTEADSAGGESTETDGETVSDDPFQNIDEIEEERSVSDPPFDGESPKNEAESANTAAESDSGSQSADTPDDEFDEQNERTENTAEETASPQQPTPEETAESTAEDPESPAEGGAEADNSESARSKQEDEQSGGNKKIEQIQQKKREMLLDRSYYGETRDEVDVDTSDCLQILRDEEYDLYKQCQAPVGEDQNFCQHHPKQEQPTVSAESDD